MTHVIRLRAGFRDAWPGTRSRASAPELVQACERRLAHVPIPREPATDDEIRAADAGAAMEIDTLAFGKDRIEFVQDGLHLAGGFWQAVILDRHAQVADITTRAGLWQQHFVCLEFPRRRQVEKAVDARLEQSPQPVARRLFAGTRGILAREDPSRFHPVAVRQRRRQ